MEAGFNPGLKTGAACPHRCSALLGRWIYRRTNRGIALTCPISAYNSDMDTATLKEQIISASPEVMGGTPVFAGTRVPVQTLLDYVEAGDSINDFLDGFPTVRREQIIGFLEEAKERMIALVA